MPSRVTTPFGSRYEPDAFDSADRFNADYNQRLTQMALGVLGQNAQYKLGMAQLGNQRDMFQAGLGMNAQALGSQERMHSGDLAFAGKGLQMQSDALSQQLALQRARDFTEQQNYQQLFSASAPGREYQAEELKNRAALEHLQAQKEQAQLEAEQKAAAGGLGAPTNLSDFERGTMQADISGGMTPAQANLDISTKRRAKAETAAKILSDQLAGKARNFKERDLAWLTADPTQADVDALGGQRDELKQKYIDSGMDEASAVAEANKPFGDLSDADHLRAGWTKALYQRLGLRAGE